MEIVSHNKPLAAIACGFPGGGTTMLAEVLRQHPKLASGFEGGLLLAEEASDFLSLEPYYSSLKNSWKLSNQDLAYICSPHTWDAVYRRLKRRSPVIKGEKQWLFDKTPRYMTCLTDVLRKVPDIPCVALVRDPRAVFWTRIKRTKKNAPDDMSLQEWAAVELDVACKAYQLHADGLSKALHSDVAERVIVIQYEKLCLNPEQETQKIFDFLGLRFNPKFSSFEDNPQYGPCHGSEVSTNYINQYKQNLSPEIIESVLNNAKDYKDWWYES